MFLHHPLMHGTFPVVLVNTQQLAGVVSLMPLFGKKRRGQKEDKKKKTTPLVGKSHPNSAVSPWLSLMAVKLDNYDGHIMMLCHAGKSGY